MYYFINFKNYKESVGKNALKLARACEQIANRKKAKVVLCVNAIDLKEIASKVNMPVFAQHTDPIEPAAYTGWILPEAVRQAGAVGTLLNHSEHRLDFSLLKMSVDFCRKAGLITVVCAAKPGEIKKIAKLKPDFIAIEPNELIGGRVSVSTAKPEVITKAVALAGRTPVLCGAGVHSKKDVMIARKLGAKGILVASAIDKARNPAKVLDGIII